MAAHSVLWYGKCSAADKYTVTNIRTSFHCGLMDQLLQFGAYPESRTDVKRCLGTLNDVMEVNSSVSRSKSSQSLLVIGLACSVLSAKTVHLSKAIIATSASSSDCVQIRWGCYSLVVPSRVCCFIPIGFAKSCFWGEQQVWFWVVLCWGSDLSFLLPVWIPRTCGFQSVLVYHVFLLVSNC